MGTGTARPGFTRREALRRLGLGAAAAPLWVESLTAFAQDHAHARPASAAPALDWKPQALSAEQNETVIALSELILPRTDTPGAKDVLVNRFVDTVLLDADPPDAARFFRGLGWLDARSLELFGVAFVKAAPDQQTALLTLVSSPVNRTLTDRDGVEFFQAMKALTIVGYYTSETGMREELHDDGQIFFASLEGCTHPEHGGTAPPAPVAPTKKKKNS